MQHSIFEEGIEAPSRPREGGCEQLVLSCFQDFGQQSEPKNEAGEPSQNKARNALRLVSPGVKKGRRPQDPSLTGLQERGGSRVSGASMAKGRCLEADMQGHFNAAAVLAKSMADKPRAQKLMAIANGLDGRTKKKRSRSARREAGLIICHHLISALTLQDQLGDDD